MFLSKKSVLSAMLVVCMVGYGFAPTTSNIQLKIALSLAFKQRMLTQRAGKAFVMKSTGEDESKRQSELDNTMTMFEENLVILKEFSPNATISNELKKVENLWLIFKKMLQSESTRDNASQVIQGCSQMLYACNDAALAIEKFSISKQLPGNDGYGGDEAIIKNINVSDKLRMLSQRFCMGYAAYHMSISEEVAKEMYKSSFDEINNSMRALMLTPVNILEIEELIASALSDWKVLRSSDESLNKRSLSPKEVYDITSRFMYKMDKVMNAYERL